MRQYISFQEPPFYSPLGGTFSLFCCWMSCLKAVNAVNAKQFLRQTYLGRLSPHKFLLRQQLILAVRQFLLSLQLIHYPALRYPGIHQKSPCCALKVRSSYNTVLDVAAKANCSLSA